MSAQGPFSSANPFSAGFLKAWVDQAGAFQDMLKGLADTSAAAIPPSMPSPLLAPWKDFIDKTGMGGFDPKMFAGAPALGLSREYQETAARLLELGQQFQQRYAEFAQQNATIMQDAFQVLKKRLGETPQASKAPAELYDAWINCAESAYAQAAHGDAFARLLAELCNISSAFKVERGKLSEQIARHLDLPSRAEVDSLHRQVRALSEAMRAVEANPAVTGAAAATAANTKAPRPAPPPAPPAARKPRRNPKRGKK